MNVWRFLAFTFVGTAAWNALLILGGAALARHLEEYEHVFGWVVLGLVGLAVAGYLWRVLTWTPRAERGDRSN